MTDRIKEVFIRELGIDENLYSEHLSYNSVPEWGSASHIVLVLALEERFGVELSSDEIVSMTNVEKIRNVLHLKGVAVDA